jgi:hypothetical protein
MLLCCVSAHIETIRLQFAYNAKVESYAQRRSDIAAPKLAFHGEIFELLDGPSFEELALFTLDVTCAEHPLPMGRRAYGDSSERVEAEVRALFTPIDARNILEVYVSFQSALSVTPPNGLRGSRSRK